MASSPPLLRGPRRHSGVPVSNLAGIVAGIPGIFTRHCADALAVLVGRLAELADALARRFAQFAHAIAGGRTGPANATGKARRSFGGVVLAVYRRIHPSPGRPVRPGTSPYILRRDE